MERKQAERIKKIEAKEITPETVAQALADEERLVIHHNHAFAVALND